MTNGLLVGIDVGTTGVKILVVDPAVGQIAQVTRANRLESPYAGWAEADPAQWLANVEAGLRELSPSLVGRPIAAIAATGMVPAIVAIDAAGSPVRAAILQNDARATAEVEALAEALASTDAHAMTGSLPSQQSVAPKAMWLERREPDAWAQARLVVGSYDWILMALGAEPHVEANWALESGLFTLSGDVFAPAVEVVPGLSDRLAPVRRSGEVVGQLRGDLAQRVGLPADIPLVVGGADHVLSAYTAGLREPGDWLVKLGGAGDILAVSREAVTDARFFLDEHPVEGLWLPNGCMATSGSLVRWVQQLLRIGDLAAMDDEAAVRPPADILCLPYFLGEKTPRNDPDLRGVVAGLHLGHSAADVYRSALEGIAFGFRHNADVLRSRGIVLDHATVTNGGATSRLWKLIHASVLGVPLRTIRNHPGASLGAAFVAGIGVGTFAEWDEPLTLVLDGDTIDPDPVWADRYDEAYGLWRELGDVTAGTMRALARG